MVAILTRGDELMVFISQIGVVDYEILSKDERFFSECWKLFIGKIIMHFHCFSGIYKAVTLQYNANAMQKNSINAAIGAEFATSRDFPW